MDLAGPDRQWSRLLEDLDLALQIVVGAKIAVELPGVSLFDDQQPLYSLYRLMEFFGLRRQQQAYGNKARIHSFGGGPRLRLAHRVGG